MALTAELLRECPAAAARKLLPVMLKTTLAIREPTSFKGGHLICLAKKIGAAMKCSDYRSILISAVPAKVLHRYYRNQLVPVHAGHKPDMQMGALGGVGIEAVSLAARTFQLWRHSLRLPWAIICVDVQAAFYRVIRQLIVPTSDDDDALLALLHRMKVPPTAVTELMEQLKRLAILPLSWLSSAGCGFDTGPDECHLVQDRHI